jgi:hypothetical protein
VRSRAPVVAADGAGRYLDGRVRSLDAVRVPTGSKTGFAGVVVRVAAKASDDGFGLSAKFLELLTEVSGLRVWEQTTPFTQRLLSSLSASDLTWR